MNNGRMSEESEATPQPAEPAEGAQPQENADDEMRRRFREALAHKQSHAQAGGVDPRDEGKVHAHRDQARRRMFRRKSG